MRERPIGEIMSGASVSSIADRGQFLTDYRMFRIMPPASGERWRGNNLKEPAAVTKFIFDLSNEIDKAWEAEYKSASDDHFDIGAYARVAILAQDLALNVVATAFKMVDSEDENQARVGKSVLFHKYLNTAIAGIFQLKARNPQLDFDPGPVFETAIEITQAEIKGFDLSLPLQKLPPRIHSKVISAGSRHLAQITGFPIGYFDGIPGSLDSFQDKIESDDHVSGNTSEDKMRLAKGHAELGETIYPDWNPEPTVPGRSLIEEALTSLSIEKRRIVLSARIGLEDGHVQSYTDIADTLDLTMVRISQIEAAAIRGVRRRGRRLTGENVWRYKTKGQVIRVIGQGHCILQN